MLDFPGIFGKMAQMARSIGTLHFAARSWNLQLKVLAFPGLRCKDLLKILDFPAFSGFLAGSISNAGSLMVSRTGFSMHWSCTCLSKWRVSAHTPSSSSIITHGAGRAACAVFSILDLGQTPSKNGPSKKTPFPVASHLTLLGFAMVSLQGPFKNPGFCRDFCQTPSQMLDFPGIFGKTPS